MAGESGDALSPSNAATRQRKRTTRPGLIVGSDEQVSAITCSHFLGHQLLPPAPHQGHYDNDA